VIDASEAAVSTVKTSYVDDCVKSVDSEDIAIKLAEEVKLLLASGGFQLTKFSSNSRKVLWTFCHDELAPGLKDLDLGDLPVSKALGVYWNAESDDFVVHVSLREKPITRRGVLSQASQLFDPIGMIQPFILPIKGLLQRVWGKVFESGEKFWSFFESGEKGSSLGKGFPNALRKLRPMLVFGLLRVGGR